MTNSKSIFTHFFYVGASHRKEFDAMLNGVEFKEMVHKYVPEVAEANQPDTSVASPRAHANNKNAPDHETPSQLIISVPTTTPVPTANTQKKRTSLKKKNASRLDTEPKAKNSKQTLVIIRC